MSDISPFRCNKFSAATACRDGMNRQRWRRHGLSPTQATNVHHLALSFYVAKHRGIMPAVRNIPYGIQQPAVSAHVAQLEEFLGVTLFQRRPFALTPPGEKLYAFIQPFFSNLDKIANDLQGGQARNFRI